ncbi:hypothetical protein [Chryseolinea soli]|nr:hypothetical protein [Chryseolinea soli]
MTLQCHPRFNILTVRVVLPLLMVAALVSCRRKIELLHIQSHQNLTLIDSIVVAGELMEFHSCADFMVYYLGESTDTIVLPRQPISSRVGKGQYGKYENAHNWAKITPNNISIQVDTLFHMLEPHHFSHPDEESGNWIVDSIKYQKAFPIVITNHSDSLLYLGTHNMIRRMVQEVKDDHGRWVMLDKEQLDLCGVLARDLILDPKNMLIAKLPRYKGNTKAAFRLKFGFKDGYVYSNTFWDYFDMAKLKPSK